MNSRKASTVNFRFWFDRQVRNARKQRMMSGSIEYRHYYGKLLGKSVAEGRS